MANEEKPFEELVELYAAAMQKKFGSEVAEAFKDSLDDLVGNYPLPSKTTVIFLYFSVSLL